MAVTRQIFAGFASVKRPVALTFVLDTSGSMNGAPLQQAKVGARTFIEGLPDGDQVRLLFFASGPHWHSQQPQPVSSAKAALAAAVDGAFAEGGTALYDAILEALRPVPGLAPGVGQAVVVLTDGQDTDSRTSLEALLEHLQRQGPAGESMAGEGPRIFTIAYGEKADPAVLQRIAEAGGGAFFKGTPKDIQSVYAELATFF